MPSLQGGSKKLPKNVSRKLWQMSFFWQLSFNPLCAVYCVIWCQSFDLWVTDGAVRSLKARQKGQYSISFYEKALKVENLVDAVWKVFWEALMDVNQKVIVAGQLMLYISFMKTFNTVWIHKILVLYPIIGNCPYLEAALSQGNHLSFYTHVLINKPSEEI